MANKRIAILLLCLDLTSSDFQQQHTDNITFASIGAPSGQREPVLYQSGWTDDLHYICQYSSE